MKNITIFQPVENALLGCADVLTGVSSGCRRILVGSPADAGERAQGRYEGQTLKQDWAIAGVALNVRLPVVGGCPR
jgi:hypothetical protein